MQDGLSRLLQFLVLIGCLTILCLYFQVNPLGWVICWWRREPRPNFPQHPKKRRRPGWLARFRARLGVRHRGENWTVGFSNAFLSTSVEFDDLRHHALICGATGSGKTSALQSLVDAFADKIPVIIVDCKASAVLRRHVAAQPNAFIWTIGGETRWDPLRGDPTSVANRLSRASGIRAMRRCTAPPPSATSCGSCTHSTSPESRALPNAFWIVSILSDSWRYSARAAPTHKPSRS
jgi:hypothetical protein